MTDHAESDRDVFTFICTHSDNDDRTPERLEVFRHRRGNGSWAYRTRARRTINDPATRDAFLREVRDPRGAESDDQWVSAYRGVSAALRALNHHDLICTVCGFNERIGGDDLEELFQWARTNGLVVIPLRATRRILALMDG